MSSSPTACRGVGAAGDGERDPRPDAPPPEADAAPGVGLPPEAYTLLGRAGVNTVVQIGCTPPHARAAQEARVAIVRVPHAACDNIGLNLLLDEVERRHGPLNVIPCNAFQRIDRGRGRT